MTEDLLLDDIIFTTGLDTEIMDKKLDKVEKAYKEFRSTSTFENKDDFSFDTGGDDFSWG